MSALRSAVPTALILVVAVVAIPQAARAQAKTTKFFVTLGAGPFKGTYEVASANCDAGLHKPGSWNALWETDGAAAKGTLSSVMIGIDPRPTFGNGIVAVVEFGGDEHKVLYEIQKTTPVVTERGQTATLVFKGRGQVADYNTGDVADGGEVEIRVECGKVTRY